MTGIREQQDAEIIEAIARFGTPTVKYVFELMARLSELDWSAIGHRLRTARIALEVGETEAAAAFGVSLRTYRGYEAGHATEDIEGFAKFSRKYRVSFDWLFDGRSSIETLAMGGGGAMGNIMALRAAGGACKRGQTKRP